MTPIGSDSTLRSLLEELVAARGKLAGRASLAVLERTMDRGEMPPLHVHKDDEAFQVLDGSLVFLVGGECLRLEAGESFVAPAGVPHTHRVESDSVRYRAVAFVQSVELYERFLAAVALPLAGSAKPHEDERVVATLAAANGITVLGAPGALPGTALAA
jgi:quercetin dioxygenase-like cupin family protein